MSTTYTCAPCDKDFEIPGAHREKRYLCPDCGHELSLAFQVEAEVPFPRPQGAVGPYRLLEQIGRGGTGVVFRAVDERTSRTVALKCLHGMTPDEVARFTREAKVASMLAHDHIARVLDVGEAGGTPYIALEFLDGRTLDQADLPMRGLLKAMATIAWAVHHAHEQGVLHRDLKPRNLLIDAAGKPWVLDFGLSKRVKADASTPTLSMTGLILGTPAYMSPEQARGDVHKLDRRTDVYGLGATLYHALTGAAPFSGESPIKVLMKVLSEDPAPLHRLNPNTSDALCRVVEKAMSKSPEARYATALAFAEDVERVLAGEPVTAAADRDELADLEETLASVSEALVSFPNDATLYGTRARVRSELAKLMRRRDGDPRRELLLAADDATRSLERGAGGAMLLLRGRLRTRLGDDLEGAVADLQKARELLPGDPQARSALAKAYAAMARRQAKRDLDASVLYESARAEAASLRGRLLASIDLSYARHRSSRGGDAVPLLEEAVLALDACVAADAKDAQALRLRGDACRAWAAVDPARCAPLAQRALEDYDAALRLVTSDRRCLAGRRKAEALIG